MKECKRCGKIITEKLQRKFCSIECSNSFFNKRDRKEYRKKYWQQNKEKLLPKRKKYWKIYSQANQGKLKIKAKKYYQENQHKIKYYYEKNKEKIHLKKKDYYIKNKVYLNKKNREGNKKLYVSNLLSWKNYISEKTNCQICGRNIFFGKFNRRNAIHFDHKQDTIIKGTPTSWLGRHPRNLKNEEIWKECNFGMLCRRCNAFLPTKNRKDFIKKVINYIGGL